MMYDSVKVSDPRSPRGRQGGFLLVTVLFVALVVSILALGTAFTSLIDRQVASRQRVGTEAYYLAQAGLDRVKTALFLAMSEEARSGSDVCIPNFVVDIGDGIVLTPGEWTFGIEYGSGWLDVRFERSGNYFVVTSVGYLAAAAEAEQRAAQSTLQLVVAAGEGIATVWDNAIFTTRLTASSGDITGTIAAYGSVHVVAGDVELDASEESFVGSGTSGIFNNYLGRGTQTNAVEAARRALGDARAEDPGDLCSRLKVEEGSVRVQSNATGIGAAGDDYDADGAWVGPASGELIQSIAGVHLGNGNLVDQNGNPLSSDSRRQIYSRTGISGYEGFEDDFFPELPVGFPDYGDAAVLNVANCDLIVDGQLRLPPLAVGDEDCGDDDNFLRWNEEEGVIEIGGIVAVPDDSVLIRRRSPSDPPVVYSGTGELRVGRKLTDERGSGTGQIDLRAELLPIEPDENYKPGGHALALITAGDISVSGLTGSRPTLSALMYAEGHTDFAQQVAVVGAVVGRSVNVQQVPRVLHHPDVAGAADFMCIIGSVCWEGESSNPGPWEEVSIEVR